MVLFLTVERGAEAHVGGEGAPLLGLDVAVVVGGGALLATTLVERQLPLMPSIHGTVSIEPPVPGGNGPPEPIGRQIAQAGLDGGVVDRHVGGAARPRQRFG